MRQGDYWLSWEEVKFYAALFDFPTVPELTLKIDRQLGPQAYAAQLSEAASQDSLLGLVIRLLSNLVVWKAL